MPLYAKQTQRRRSLHIGRTHDQHFIAEAFPPARQGTILNNNRVIGIATNTSMVLIWALVTYLMMTASGCSLTSYLGMMLNCIPFRLVYRYTVSFPILVILHSFLHVNSYKLFTFWLAVKSMCHPCKQRRFVNVNKQLQHKYHINVKKHVP